MNKDAIRKMLNAKYKYSIKVIFKKLSLPYSKEKNIITHIIVTKSKINSIETGIINNGYEQICYCMKDVKEHVKWLKNLNKLNRPKVIGL